MKNFSSYMKTISHSELRETLKSIVAIMIGTGSWILLGWLIYAQFKTSQSFAYQLAATSPDNKERIVLIKDANETVIKTSSSLFSLLMPVATAITGYFFITSGVKIDKRNKADSPQLPNSPGP